MLYINEGDFLMSLITIIALIVALVLVLMFYNMYVQLIKKRNKVRPLPINLWNMKKA